MRITIEERLICDDDKKNEAEKNNEAKQLIQLTNALLSITRDLEKIVNHITAKRRWYQDIGIKDITIVIALLAFVFTVFEFRDTYTKFQQRSRMVQSIANTALRLSQDLAFRPDGAVVKEQVIDRTNLGTLFPTLLSSRRNERTSL